MPVFDGIDGYWFIEGSAVKKVDSQGTALATYSNIALGNPSFVDVTDPFRIAVFYAESQFLVMLSTDASISGNPISVQDLSLGEVNLLCRSSRGGFWLYIHPRGELIHIDESLKATNLRLNVPHTYEFSSKSFLCEHNGLLYLGSNREEIFRWDLYGAEKENVTIPYDEVRFEGDYIWVKKEAEISRVNLNDETEPTNYFCPCNFLPLSIQGQAMCFDGIAFKLCKKID